MTGTERKLQWRERNPERYAEYERLRAQARRRGYWGVWESGQPKPRLCRASDSYWRYENSSKRLLQRIRHQSAAKAERLELYKMQLKMLFSEP